MVSECSAMLVWVRTFGYGLKGMVENMRFDDLLSMSVNNLKRRRLRTLTGHFYLCAGCDFCVIYPLKICQNL